jgi:serine/threonine protein kinase
VLAVPHAGRHAPTGPEDHNRPEPPSLAAVSAAFPQLEILGLIGYGGMGAVFKARQPKLDRLVALKLLPASLAERDASFEGRFEREGRLLARLHHPNIVAVHDSGTAGGFFHLLMEFVEGVNLRQAMRSRRFTPAQALAIVPHICDAMQFAHDEGVLHRDIKPGEHPAGRKRPRETGGFRYCQAHGRWDCRRRQSRTSQGRPLHPDRFHAKRSDARHTQLYGARAARYARCAVDHRADIYSLGVVFYELLTASCPPPRLCRPSTKSAADPRSGRDRARRRLKRSAPPAEQRGGGEDTGRDGGSGKRGQLKQPGGMLRRRQRCGGDAGNSWRRRSGQMFLYRKKTHLQITDREFIYTQNGVPVVVPHTAIQDVSIGHFAEGDQWAVGWMYECHARGLRCVEAGVFLPQEGVLGMPSDVNRHVAEWADALRAAVKGKDGSSAENDAADQLGMPSGASGLKSIDADSAVFAALSILVVFNSQGDSFLHTSA